MRKLSLILAISLLVISVGYAFPGIAFADTLAYDYTTALEDLQRDSTFDASKYHYVDGSGYIDIIQIAESVNNELFLYVYQQGGADFKCSSVNISQDDEDLVKDKKAWSNYKLQFLNGQGTLFKYKVVGVTVKTTPKRYYDITNILRPETSGATGSLGNVVTEVSTTVAKCFVAQTINGGVEYSVIRTEVITITNKVVGSIRYSEGFFLLPTVACDSHWVAFSTDKDIDQLYEADVEYSYKVTKSTGHYNFLNKHVDSVETIEEDNTRITVKYTETVATKGNGMLGHSYDWVRIETAKKFVEENKLTEETSKAFEKNKYEWVLRFYESRYFYTDIPTGVLNGLWTEQCTEVFDVIILRLYFRTGKKIYNLGVVDNKQQGDKVPDNTDTSAADGAKKSFEEWWQEFVEKWDTFWGKIRDAWNNYKWIFIVVIALLLLGFLALICKPIFIILKYVFKALWWFITLPVRLVVSLVRKASGKDKGPN